MAQEGEINRLVNDIRNELRVLGAVTARGLALLTADGNVLYSDMPSPPRQTERRSVPAV